MTGIYKITNKINGKIYIGQAKNICERWNKHYLTAYSDNDERQSLIHKAIRKYGIENFTFEIEELCDTDLLSEREIYFIQYYGCCVLDNEDIGYNLTRGGETISCLYENNHNSKLTQADVYNIREEYKELHRKADVFEKYKDTISINTFSDIWNGKTWTGIHDDVYTPDIKAKQRHNYDTMKSHKCRAKVSEEEIKAIRNMKNDLMSKKDVHDNYFRHININTFNDIWYYRTFKQISADNLPKRGKRRRSDRQDGCCNPCATLTSLQVADIRHRKSCGENIKDVYAEYNFVTFVAFRRLWNGETYKNF